MLGEGEAGPLHGGTPLGHARHFAERWVLARGPEIVAYLEQAAATSRA